LKSHSNKKVEFLNSIIKESNEKIGDDEFLPEISSIPYFKLFLMTTTKLFCCQNYLGNSREKII